MSPPLASLLELRGALVEVRLAAAMPHLHGTAVAVHVSAAGLFRRAHLTCRYRTGHGRRQQKQYKQNAAECTSKPLHVHSAYRISARTKVISHKM